MLADACALASIGSRSLQPRLLAKGLQPFAAITALGMHISTTSTHAFWGGKAAEGAAKPGTKDAIVTTASGLQYVDHVVGTGDKPEAGWIVQVHYVGTLLASGAQFDSSRDPKRGPLEFAVGQGRVIQGWEEGIMSMRVGGKRRLIVPPQLGYGAKGAGSVIPPNASLVFEVELVSAKVSHPRLHPAYTRFVSFQIPMVVVRSVSRT
jgi:peptidylprolyl isomerase